MFEADVLRGDDYQDCELAGFNEVLEMLLFSCMMTVFAEVFGIVDAFGSLVNVGTGGQHEMDATRMPGLPKGIVVDNDTVN